MSGAGVADDDHGVGQKDGNVADGRHRPQVYSIAAHRGFADALVAGLIPRYREEAFGLARLTLLLPSTRAVRTVTEAFVRASAADGHGGLLLPRMAVVGDLDLDETLGPLLDPLGAGADVPPAIDPVLRLLRIADLLRGEVPAGTGEASLLRQARNVVGAIDRLGVEDVDCMHLLDPDLVGVVGELSQHWKDNTRLFAATLIRWQAELDERGAIDPPVRRNRLLQHIASAWAQQPPAHPVVAAGVTSASPAVARLLRVVAELPRGAVILPDLDLTLDQPVWDALGLAGQPREAGGPVFGRGDATTHPQYHLKLLLNRMGLARDEVQPWHRSGLAAAPPARSRAISNLFLPPEASAKWATLPAEQRRLSGVRLMESAHPDEEAQAVAVLVREALAVPERRVAVITPDRALAQRIVAHLGRWNIQADDSAGIPLAQTAPGRLLLHLADTWAEAAAPVPLLALLGHPLVANGPERADWLDHVRLLDLALRGPRPGPGTAAIGALLTARRKDFPQLESWWPHVEALLAPLLMLEGAVPLDATLAQLAQTAEALCGEALWAQPAGRALAAFVEQWTAAAAQASLTAPPAEVAALLRDALGEIAVRPPYGGHPRLAIYGLLEARMSRADLVICAGLTEGSWPGAPATDALLAPAVLRALGIPGADFRIGLAAHDLAGALGAPEVVLSHARRDSAGPAIASRFLLRIHAMLGDHVAIEADAVRHARRLGRVDIAVAPAPQPKPMPSAEQRKVDIAATALDRLRGDPYQFYASAILNLRALDALDAAPSPAWKGTAVHGVLEAWHQAGAPPGGLVTEAERQLSAMSGHPFMRALWQPRLLDALRWIEERQITLQQQGRIVALSEKWGDIQIKGVRLHGKADRIDHLPDGKLAVVDYKTGKPPSARMVEQGYALQLGLIALIAERGGFKEADGAVDGFEYWSLARKQGNPDFGYCEEPVLEGRRKSGLPRDEFVARTLDYLEDAIDRWILGNEPFTARLNPDLPGYSDYDQLMRLDEWQGRANRKDTPA
ncbi:double-strand break repair protein AddB [Novosphingobium sp.]|uniref:double-strand break repair protein AddB n=1 Tax=Novosphingobium sp. TaxID=1874826 RepID=UPI0038BA4723